MPSWVVQAGRAGIVLSLGPGLTRYFPPWGHIYDQPTEVWATLRSSDAYTCSNLLARVTANTLTAASTLRSRVALVNGNQLITIPAGTTGLFEDAVNSDAWGVSIDLCSQLVTGATGTSITITLISFLLFATTDIPMLGWNNGAGAAPSGDYMNVTGSPAWGGAANYTFRAAATLTNLFFSVEANSRPAASTWRTYINGIAGNLLITIPAFGTGYYADDVNSDAVAVGDGVIMFLSLGGAAGTMQVRGHKLKSASVGRQTVAARATAFSPGTVYNTVEGWLLPAAAEVDSQGEANASIAAQNLFVRVIINPTGAASTVALRRNGADTTLLVTIPAGTIGVFENLTDIVSLVAADLIDYRVTIGGAAAVDLSQVGFQQGPTAAAAGFGGVADKMRVIGAI